MIRRASSLERAHAAASTTDRPDVVAEDYIGGTFTSKVKDPEDLTWRMMDFCHDLENPVELEKDLRKQFDADIADTEAYIEDAAERMRQVWELFGTMEPKQVIADETLFRELKDRFGSPFGFGEYFRGGMGAEAVRDLLRDLSLDEESL